MSIQFCVVREKESGHFLVNATEYDPGYRYSEYTYQNPSYDVYNKYAPIEKIYGSHCDIEDMRSLVIFESREVASKFLDSMYGEDAHLYEALSFAEIDAIVEATLLGK